MIVSCVIGRPFRNCFHSLYPLVSLPFSVARTLLQGVKRSLLVPFVLWPRNIIVWGVKSNHPPKTNVLTSARHFDGGIIGKNFAAHVTTGTTGRRELCHHLPQVECTPVRRTL